MKRYSLLALLALPLCAHHGVPSVSLAGLEGPGAPVETTSSATLPKGGALAYLKLDHAEYKTYTDARDGEGLRSDYWMAGAGYGFTPWLSAYLFAPYYTKAADDASTSSDFHDLTLLGVVGFVYDEGVRLVPQSESLDDLEDWHFTLSLQLTLPTGESNRKNGDGSLVDPGWQTGFGTPSYMLGFSATKWLGNAWTLVGDVSYNAFIENEYSDGSTMRFGDELRLNAAATCKVLAQSERKLRLDLNMEANYLNLGRDVENGEAAEATGGEILYLTPGVRLFMAHSSLALGIKLPAWTDLNEADDQQGAEGKERYRAVLTFSTLF
ncbi:MAG: transporter [Campylobacterales bacterium]|nr:transporter [Campylobacterales bacterium]